MSISDDYLNMSKAAAARESRGWDVCTDQTAPKQRDPLRVVLLNGPPRAGKDFAAAAIIREFHGAGLVKFAGPLKRATHEAFGLTDRADAHYENCKDEPHPDFGDLTPRAAYIAMSEQGIKSAFGHGHFGRAAVNRMRNLYSRGLQLAVVSDSGFVGEALEVVKAFGPENVLLIQLFRDGYSFKGDSRSYINLPEDVSWCIVRNEGDATFTDKIKARVRAWLAGELA